MLSRIKHKLKMAFPNLYGDLLFFQYRRKDYKNTHKLLRLNEADYSSYLNEFYERKTGYKLNLDHPERFSEKVQWRKLNDRNEIYSLLSDKYQVRQWVEKKIGSQYLIPLLGCWNSFDDIDFNTLPDQFVLKTNNYCHTNIIVKNKNTFLREKRIARKKISYWLHSCSYYYGLELHYKNIKPLIIAEQYLHPKNADDDLADFKFHCFSGTPFMCEVINGRYSRETVDYFDINWKHLPIMNPPFPNSIYTMEKPTNYDLMVELATKLSQGFAYVRVDLYNNGNIYFGEMTFTPANGNDKYDPDEWDYRLGALWDIHSIQIDRDKIIY